MLNILPDELDKISEKYLLIEKWENISDDIILNRMIFSNHNLKIKSLDC